ncbi:hypothetical protein BHM03_00049124, partial [Ensete ventricosum]
MAILARVDPTERGLGNCNEARVDPAERELGNCNEARVDPTERELGNCNKARVDPTDANPGDLAEKMNSGANPEVAMTSSDSSTSVRVVSPSGSGETSRSDPEVDSSGASSGPPSPVDARVQRDLEGMISDHDLDTAVTEGSLAVIRERYSIPAEYGLHVPEPGQRPYSLDVPGMCISVDALEAVLRSRDYPDSGLIHGMFSSLQESGGYYLTARVGFRVSGAPSSNKGWKSRYLYVSGPAWGFGLDWSAHPIGNAPPYLSEEETVLVGRLKGILSSSRAIKEMTELWLVEAGLSPTSRGTSISLCFSFPSFLLTCKLGCSPDGSRGASRDAENDWQQGS